MLLSHECQGAQKQNRKDLGYLLWKFCVGKFSLGRSPLVSVRKPCPVDILRGTLVR